MEKLLLVLMLSIGLNVYAQSNTKEDAQTQKLKRQVYSAALHSTEYQSQWVKINQIYYDLQNAIGLHRDPTNALGRYNQEYGIVMGKRTTVKQAYNVLKEKKEGYLKYILFRKAGEIALQRAGEAQAKADELKY